MKHQEVYALVRRVPRGRVVTYGQVAALLGRPGAARQVGYALAALGAETLVPWHRVVNARGAISPRSGAGEISQRLLLEREGVGFRAGGRIDLEIHGWCPDGMKRSD